MVTPAIGIFLPTMSERNAAPGDVAAAARHAEELGFESVWVVDQLVAGTGVPVLDSGVALAAAAGVTSRVGLAYGVLIVPLHPLAWLLVCYTIPSRLFAESAGRPAIKSSA